MKDSRFYMWGERGIIATFFADMHLWASAEDWETFLASISISAKNFPSTLDEVVIIVEPDFGNRGFGHPDLVLAIRHGAHRSVILFEAKRVPYLQACRKKRGDQYYNSTLKGQLELNYILSTALSLYTEHDRHLKQPEWVKRTPYAIGGRPGHEAILKSSIVLDNVVSNLSGLPLESYFHVAISTDASNPFEDTSNESVFPEIYDGDSLDRNKWDTIKDRFGWLNYDALCKVADKIDRRNQSSHSSLFFESFGLNKLNLAKPRCNTGIGHGSKNRILVYLPDVNAHTFLHCSFQGEKCKLRDYSIHPIGAPSVDERFRTSDILSRAVCKLEASRVPIGNIEFWHREIKKLNAIHLSRCSDLP